MARSSFLKATSILASLQILVSGQTTSDAPTSVVTVDIGGTPTTFRDVFTIPASADQGQPLIPNIQDPEAVNAQDVCPGYTASQLQENENGLSAVLTLAGAPCNVYGNDVETLNLKVEYQSENRLAVQIYPANVVSPQNLWAHGGNGW
jgi:alpha-glucosidase